MFKRKIIILVVNYRIMSQKLYLGFIDCLLSGNIVLQFNKLMDIFDEGFERSIGFQKKPNFDIL